eukprot:8191198-Pyramimonas_sp.AAC.1
MAMTTMVVRLITAMVVITRTMMTTMAVMAARMKMNTATKNTMNLHSCRFIVRRWACVYAGSQAGQKRNTCGTIGSSST